MNTTRHTDSLEVILKDRRRRRCSLAEKQALVRCTYDPGMSVSLVGRQEGVSVCLLCVWRKLERQGALAAVSAGEAMVPAAARAEMARLQCILEYAEEKSGLRTRPCCRGRPMKAVRRLLAVQRSDLRLCSDGQTVTATFAKDCYDRGDGLARRPPR